MDAGISIQGDGVLIAMHLLPSRPACFFPSHILRCLNRDRCIPMNGGGIVVAGNDL